MIYVSPSLLAADFANLQTEVEKIEQAGATHLHLDVMDGAFVSNISFGAPVISSLRAHSKLIFDVHLMINDPIRYVKDFVKAGADMITVHVESCEHPEEALREIRSYDVKCGIVLSPATPVEKIFPYLSMVDMALVMTVVPGLGGQKFMPEMLEKVKAIRAYAKEHSLTLDVEVDGGLNAENTKDAVAAGANVIVAGSAIFKAKDPKAVIRAMKNAES